MCGKPSWNGLVHPGCKRRGNTDGVLAVVSYKGIIKKLLYQFKYKPYISDLKTPLARLMCEGLIQNETFMSFINSSPQVWITCVPIGKKRELMRGYNQSALLAKEIAIRLGVPFAHNLLLRLRETQPQFELKKEERVENLKNAFGVNGKYSQKLIGKTIIIVDDIATTGSTLRECGKVLKRSGAKRVLGVALAHEG